MVVPAFAEVRSQNEAIDLDGIDEITIEVKHLFGSQNTVGMFFVSTNATVSSYNGDKFLAELTEEVSGSKETNLPQMYVEQKDNKVRIFFVAKKKIKFSFISTGKINLNIKVPENYRGKINLESNVQDILIENLTIGTLHAKNDNGNLILNNVEADELVASSSSGNIDLDNIKAQKAEIFSSTGNIKGGDLTVKDGYYYNSVGNIKIESLNGINSKIYNCNGYVKIEELMGGLDVENLNASINVTILKLTKDVRVKCDNGTTRLYLPKDSAFNYKYTNGLGTVKFDFDLEENKEKIDFVTKSGTVNGGGPLLQAAVGQGTLRVKFIKE